MRTRARSLATLFAPLFATLLLLGACDKADDKKADKKTVDKKADDKAVDDKAADAKAADAKPAEPEPKPVETITLTLGAAKIMEKDKPEEAIELLADGTVKLGPNPENTLKISTDGKISKADGTVVAQVAADGSLSFDGKPSGVVLNDTGLTLTSPDGKKATVVFGEDGSVVTDPPAGDGLQMVAEGCAGPMAKTCGLVITMLVMQDEPAPGGAAEAHAPAAVVEAKPPVEAKPQ